MHKVANAHPWPEMQRFDYIVRTRKVSSEELSRFEARSAEFPQRQAILLALRAMKDKPRTN